MLGKTIFGLCIGLLSLTTFSCQKSDDVQNQATQQTSKSKTEQLQDALVEIRGIMMQITDHKSAELYSDELIKARNHLFQLSNSLSSDEQDLIEKDKNIINSGQEMRREINRLGQANFYHSKKLQNAFIAK